MPLLDFKRLLKSSLIAANEQKKIEILACGLLDHFFSEEYLGTHSKTGNPSNAWKGARDSLPGLDKETLNSVESKLFKNYRIICPKPESLSIRLISSKKVPPNSVSLKILKFLNKISFSLNFLQIYLKLMLCIF